MYKKITPHKPLMLTIHTIRHLTHQQLEHVGGGAPVPTSATENGCTVRP